MKKEVPKKYQITQNIIAFLNIFLAISIIVTSQRLAATQFGQTSLIFGFIMLAITTILLIIQKL
ncbi:MAG: hypothetical protein IIA87_00790 [Nanoarchaeota archaeon]|nr:hypothetical protein [Nanoarchaeota archaeon]